MRDKLTLIERVEARGRQVFDRTVGRAVDALRRKTAGAGEAKVTRLSTRDEPREHTVLIVSHAKKRCGINQYGLNVYEALALSRRYAVAYAECADERDLDQAMVTFNPSLVLYNYYPATMPWLTPAITRKYQVATLGVMHEVTQEEADRADRSFFDHHVCPDPTLREDNSAVVKVPRIIPPYRNTRAAPERVRVGTFGFGAQDKGFTRLIARVQDEYDEADISILMPFNDVVDPEGSYHALETAQACRRAVYKPGVRLEISHDFVSKEELLDFLAGNTVNAFFYDTAKQRGISSTVEHALAVQRPLAITRSGMFRHVSGAVPSICIEETSLRQIVANGTAPLEPFYREWTPANFTAAMERIFDRVLDKHPDQEVRPLAARGFNKILDNQARREHAPTIARLFQVAPSMMVRKIQEANVQQAFVADAVLHFARGPAGPGGGRSPRVLCVGSFEDTATELLRAEGLHPEEVDPAINHDLDSFFRLSSTARESYDLIYSTSVLEHVRDDGLFIAQICRLLRPGGVAVLTCDFNERYRPGLPKPDVDYRLYTARDLEERLGLILKREGCSLVDAPAWREVQPDFVYMGIYRYTFATLVFRKREGAAAEDADGAAPDRATATVTSQGRPAR